MLSITGLRKLRCVRTTLDSLHIRNFVLKDTGDALTSSGILQSSGFLTLSLILRLKVYCGIPTGMVSFRIAEEALNKMKAE